MPGKQNRKLAREKECTQRSANGTELGLTATKHQKLSVEDWNAASSRARDDKTVLQSSLKPATSLELFLSGLDTPFNADPNPNSACCVTLKLFFFLPLSFLLSWPYLRTRIADKAFYKQPNSDVIGFV